MNEQFGDNVKEEGLRRCGLVQSRDYKVRCFNLYIIQTQQKKQGKMIKNKMH